MLFFNRKPKSRTLPRTFSKKPIGGETLENRHLMTAVGFGDIAEGAVGRDTDDCETCAYDQFTPNFTKIEIDARAAANGQTLSNIILDVTEAGIGASAAERGDDDHDVLFDPPTDLKPRPKPTNSAEYDLLDGNDERSGEHDGQWLGSAHTQVGDGPTAREPVGQPDITRIPIKIKHTN